MAVGRFGPVLALYPDSSAAINEPFEVRNDDGSLATIFVNSAGVPGPNPKTTTGLGEIEFYAEEGAYDVVILESGFTMTVVVYPPGVVAELGEVKVQSAAAATWSFSHSLGRLPTVALYLASGEEVETDIVASTTQVVATWPSPIAGKMVLT